MKNKNLITITLTVIFTIVGFSLKINSYKTSGDIFLFFSTTFWFYLIYTFLFNSRKKEV